jgi:hypothetical protein
LINLSFSETNIMTDGLENTVFGDLAVLEKSLSEDLTGDRARSMLSYFDEVTRSSEDRLGMSLPDGERQLMARLIDGFRASQRIIRHVWETQHSMALVG